MHASTGPRPGPRAGTPPRIAFLQHGPLELPGVLGTHAARLGLDVRCFRADRIEDGLPDPDEFAGIVVLGSVQSVNDPLLAWVAPERAFVASAVMHHVPVFGVCFGGQLLAQVLGGRVVRSPEPELGWAAIQSDDPSLVPPGPWLLWHEEAVELPPGVAVIARTDVAIQAYVEECHTGVQFHPEVTTDIVRAWIHEARQRDELTPEDRRALWDDIDRLTRGSEANAGALFDGFLRRAGLLTQPG
jgi:GMP synthase-like glutamine amidotransferase